MRTYGDEFVKAMKDVEAEAPEWKRVEVIGNGGDPISISGPMSGYGDYMEGIAGFAASLKRIIGSVPKEVAEMGADCECETCKANKIPLTVGDVVQVARGPDEALGLIGIINYLEEGSEHAYVMCIGPRFVDGGTDEMIEKAREAAKASKTDGVIISGKPDIDGISMTVTRIPLFALVRIGRAASVHKLIVGKSKAEMDAMPAVTETDNQRDWVRPKDSMRGPKGGK